MVRFDVIERVGPNIKCSHTSSWHFSHSLPTLWRLEFWETWWCHAYWFLASCVSGVVASKNTWIIKVYVFIINYETEAEVSSSPAERKLHLKKSWACLCCFYPQWSLLLAILWLPIEEAAKHRRGFCFIKLTMKQYFHAKRFCLSTRRSHDLQLFLREKPLIVTAKWGGNL